MQRIIGYTEFNKIKEQLVGMFHPLGEEKVERLVPSRFSDGVPLAEERMKRLPPCG